MKIFNNKTETYSTCIAKELRPLFNAMLEDKIIKSVTCMSSLMNKLDKTKDFTIKNFKAVSYFVGKKSNYQEIKNFDLVCTDKDEVFYMNWVRSFEL